MNEIKTHLNIKQNLCGSPTLTEEGRAIIKLIPTNEMTADNSGLIHGGFIFGAADYAAMIAVNDPNVVLGSAEVKFLAPVKLGDTVIFESIITEKKDKKRVVNVIGTTSVKIVFSGVLTCFVLEKHVLV